MLLGLLAVHWTKKAIRSIPVIGTLASPVLGEGFVESHALAARRLVVNGYHRIAQLPAQKFVATVESPGLQQAWHQNRGV